ncbi:MAG: 6,7-dimethyl-8-ribityllumazine synthase [Ignavibacteriae bacterium]|nr:6,7-dimethyl-8-ribityllumazine synthase [Ignavibacteria bacterium]MBI3364389.1 6,7-dimethyl-8-ribityllumazine synthase [Ignavibacteriota bacterium]
MPNIIEGNLSAAPYSFALVVSRFNDFITRRLTDGALDCLRRHGANEKTIDVVYCPGAFEIPRVAQQLASSGNYNAVICLGCVIRGETPHFDYVASAVSSGIERVALASKIPIIFGVLTTNTLDQAIERAGSKEGNKGWNAALAAIEMADLQKKISGTQHHKK